MAKPTKAQQRGGSPREADDERGALRVLIANERRDRLGAITAIVHSLGHSVIAQGVEVETVGALTRRELPDVALVGLGADPDHALAMISKIVHEAACPVIALLDFDDPAYVGEAAKRGVFAYVVTDDDPTELQSALDITLRRFAEYHNLEGAFGRRAVIERAKGILMERNGIGEQEAFELLRRRSRETGRKLIDVAQAVTDSHRLLPDHQARAQSRPSD